MFTLLGFFVVILAVAGGSYWWLHSKISGAKTTDAELQQVVDETLVDSIDPPKGMDILVMGCDVRRDEEEDPDVESRSDTVMLVHTDPDSEYLSILSLPRDLRVKIPGHGMDKLNAAYAYGGPALTIQTVQDLTNINIDAYIGIDFTAFEDLTDSLGGIYLDIDRRYFNDDSTWELIKISPGYQLLDGRRALDYVRFRRDLNYDFGRMDRQQRFLTAVREQALGWSLLTKLPGVIDAVFSNVETTMGVRDMLSLAKWGIKLDSGSIRQVNIVGDTVTRDGVSYVVVEEGAVEEAVEKLLDPPEVAEIVPETPSSDEASTPSTSEDEEVEFITDPGSIENARLWSLFADEAPFAVMAPGYLPPGYQYVDRQPWEPGVYEIVPGDDKKVGFKMVYQLHRDGDKTDQYMGIMETSWLDAPAASPGQEVEVDGMKYTIVGTNQRVDRIWWKKDDTLYWVSNTLSFYLSSKELLKVAESMIPIEGSAQAGR